MLQRDEVEVAIDLQQRSYRLLKWMAEAVKRGFVTFDTAHEYSTFPEAAQQWILGHFDNIPQEARPSRDRLREFSAIFSTYMENSFVLVSDPGKQPYSVDAHCFCPICSWLIDAPNLKTKKPTAADKRRARKMKIDLLDTIALEQDVSITQESKARIVEDPGLTESLSLVTYTQDLFNRMKGVAVGPATLVLWRSFAWNSQGSPRSAFELSVDSILAEEERIRSTVVQAAV